MANVNLFLNASRFSKITQDPSALAVFISIASHENRSYEEIVEDTNLDLADVAPIVKTFEQVNYIEKNPGPLSRKFVLGFNGQLFAEQLKELYPEVKEIIGEKTLIRPIKVNRNL